MSDENSPWGSGGSGGKKPGKGGNSPWGSLGGGSNGGKPSGRGGNKPQTADLDNVIRNFKTQFGGGKGPIKRGGPSKPGLGVPIIIFGAIIFMMLASCLYTIDQNEEGVVLRFGQYTRTTGPGIHVKLPNPFENVKKVDVESNRTIEIGVGRAQNLMLTGDENIVRIGYAVIWRANSAVDYVFNLENVPVAVRDVAESAMREVVGKTDLEPLITNQRDAVAADVRTLMQEMLDEYKAGVLISKVELKQSEEPASVRQAFLEVVSAKQEAEQKILAARARENEVIPRANADADELIQEAKGYKEAVIAESQGDADRFRLIYKEYKLAPKVTRQRMYLETIEQVYSGAEKIILDSKAGSGVVPYLPLDKLTSSAKGGR